jgi:hypothetical protein
MEFFQNFGLREMVIGTAVLLGIYSGIVIIRLSRMPRRPETAFYPGSWGASTPDSIRRTWFFC